jgi:hypothetical protein
MDERTDRTPALPEYVTVRFQSGEKMLVLRKLIDYVIESQDGKARIKFAFDQVATPCASGFRYFSEKFGLSKPRAPRTKKAKESWLGERFNPKMARPAKPDYEQRPRMVGMVHFDFGGLADRARMFWEFAALEIDMSIGPADHFLALVGFKGMAFPPRSHIGVMTEDTGSKRMAVFDRAAFERAGKCFHKRILA